MAGLIFKKTVVWHLVNALLTLAGFLGGIALVIGIMLVTFTIYVVTASVHLFSVTAMLILACTLALLARDELSSSVEELIWCTLKTRVMESCISGTYTTQPGWLVLDSNESQLPFLRFMSKLRSSRYPLRVIMVTADDGECFLVGWDLRPVPVSAGHQITLPNRQVARFTEQLFS